MIRLTLICFLIISCATQDKTNEVSTVSISTEQGAQLKISKKSSTDYGPTREGGETTTNTDEGEVRNPIVELNAYSTLYSSLALIEYLKRCEKENIKISVIRASGFASLIAVLYAENQSVNHVEWKLFELIKKIDKHTALSEKWLLSIQKFLEKEFKQKRLHQLKTLVAIPEVIDRKLNLNTTGKITDSIMNSLSTTKKVSFLLRPGLFHKLEKEFGSDIKATIAFLPEKIGFKNLIDYELGVYASYLSFLEKNRDEFSSISTSDGRKYYIDELAPLSDMTSPFDSNIDQHVKSLKNQIKEWKEQNSTSSI
jgi:hypothetical protein